ncbi:two-component sensor histidine kinase [Streptosporangium violaceochromogenes]|nr:two-component sensor histidine kinase [Streptosporangium violaceochromogenes]
MSRNDALGAALCFACGLVLLAAGAYVHRPAPAFPFAFDLPFPGRAQPFVLAGPLLVSCVGVAVRRSSPVSALVLGLVAVTADCLVGPSMATILVFTDNLYSATRYGPARLDRWLLGVTSVLAVVGGTAAGIVLRDLRLLAVAVVQLGLIGITPVATGIIMKQLQDRAESERARAEQVARLAELDRQAAVNAERSRMARELHDMIANHFSAIAIQSTAMLSRDDLDQRTLRALLGSIRENSVQGMAEMRTMIGLLRQDGEEAEMTRLRVAEADELAARAREAGLEVRLRVDGEPRELPASVDLAGYRIVQESLTNALKHGDGAADLVIGYRDGLITLTVDNPSGAREGRSTGPGEPPAGAERKPPRTSKAAFGVRRALPGAGAGIIGMRERVALVGGAFEAGPRDGGWHVHAELPTGEIP